MMERDLRSRSTIDHEAFVSLGTFGPPPRVRLEASP
jgi:hypothetical protein